MKPQAIYIPVVSSGTSGEFKWWTKKCPIFYRYLLVNPINGGDKKRKHFGKECTIYADSGGFQAIDMNKKLASLNVTL